MQNVAWVERGNLLKLKYALCLSSDLYVLLSDEDLPGVGELHEEGEGQRVNIMEDHLLLLLLRQIIYRTEPEFQQQRPSEQRPGAWPFKI
jgi:hypothetical protein